MRLFEVENNFLVDLTTVLRNLLGRSNSQGVPMKLNYKAVSNMLGNMGYGEINYDNFSKLYDQNEQLQSIVSDFDETGITLKTDSEPDQGPKAHFDAPAGPSVDQMAHSAVQDIL